MPSKALLRPAQALAEARRIPGAAEVAGGEIDVEALPRLIAGEEEFASGQVRDALEVLGAEVVLGMKAIVVWCEQSKGPVTLELQDGRSYVGDGVLVAIGRTPHTDDLGLEELGLEAGKSIEVDEQMRVPGHEWLYVVGDANGHVLLTHMGKHKARLAADHILGRMGATTVLCSDGRLSPRVIFTEPQVAALGHMLQSAEEAGLKVRAVDTLTEGNAGGSFVGHGAPGTARIVLDEDRKVIVGATFTGVDVAESLHAAMIAVIGEVPLERLWHAVPCFRRAASCGCICSKRTGCERRYMLSGGRD